jgi:hypothetical protein
MNFIEAKIKKKIRVSSKVYIYYTDLVEKQIFEPSQRPLRVNSSALEEDVAVALVIVARGAGPKTDSARR